MNPIILVVGARPNFMKIAPIQKELDSRGIPNILLHTGQHYDDNMSKVFFDDLKMKKPDIYLGVGSGSHATQTAKVMVEFEQVCLENNPSMVVVQPSQTVGINQPPSYQVSIVFCAGPSCR